MPFGLPGDQRPDEHHALNYTGAPLDAPVEILGWPVAVLHVRSTAPVMAYVARLCDVAPDGTSALVCSGVLHGTRRASLGSPEPIDRDETYELQVALDCTAWRFAPGHRVRREVHPLLKGPLPSQWLGPRLVTTRLRVS